MDLDFLKKYNKIIVTGPPRSGTTICSRILAHELKYRFIDETLYDGNNPNKFSLMLHYLSRNFVIQTTAFTRDIHKYYFNQPTCIVLMKRPISDILDSFDNTKKFIDNSSNGLNVTAAGELFNGFDDDAIETIKKHFGYENNNNLTLPEVIYDHFEKNKNPEKVYLEINYDDLKNHELFIDKETRRKEFVHIKQIDLDPEYIHKRGVLVL